MQSLKNIVELIQSLTKAEKRVFKQLASAFGSNQSYIKLFDLLEKENSINIDFKKIEISKSQLNKDIDALEDMLFKTLRWLNTPNNPIYSLLENTLILTNKGLYNQANKNAEKAYLKADEKNITIAKYLALDRQIYIHSIEHQSTLFDKKTKLLNSQNEILKELEISKYLQNYQFEIADIFNNNKERELLNPIITNIKNLDISKINNIQLQTHYYLCLGQSYQILCKYDEAIRNYNKIIRILEHNVPNTSHANLINLSIAYDDAITCLIENNYNNDVQIYLLNFKKYVDLIIDLNKKDSCTYNYILSQYYSSYSLFLIHSKQYKECINFISKNEPFNNVYFKTIGYFFDDQLKIAYKLCIEEAKSNTTFKSEYEIIELCILLLKKEFDLLLSRANAYIYNKSCNETNYIQFIKLCRYMGNKAEVSDLKLNDLFLEIKSIIIKTELDRLLLKILSEKFNCK